ncbi:Hypothetical predicted protein [Mytilus galloprovincialis]|uniref:CXXC motif containing zinc binding protein n=1 Tax=Mytilus galloprovincialis TaxID=29158 RepID=A0A8B6HPX6_MYTGA|nr:Hypothetical predicted protein [Mytilus galloprovincialis]
MAKIGLQFKTELQNITNLKPDGEDFRWYLRLKCISCGEETHEFQYLTEWSDYDEKASVLVGVHDLEHKFITVK